MNTVVLHMNDDLLKRTFECSNENEQRLAANLICHDEGIDNLTDSEFSLLVETGYVHLGSGYGLIYIGGLESIN